MLLRVSLITPLVVHSRRDVMFIIVFLTLFVIAEIGLFLADRYVWSFIVLISSLAYAVFFIPDVAAYVSLVGWWVIFTEMLPIYLAIGVVIATLKWFLFVLKRARKINEGYKKFSERTATSESRSRRKDFAEYWNSNYYHLGRVSITGVNFTNDDEFIQTFTPKALNEVDRITFWVLQWPIVVVATFLEDLLIKFGKHVATLFDSIFNGVAKKIIGSSLKKI
jgi:hypothetical protein